LHEVKFKLAKQIGRVPEYKVELSKSEEERAVELHRKSIVIDLHIHPIVFPENMDDLPEYARSLKYPTGFEGLQKSGLTAYFFPTIGLKGIIEGAPWQWDDAVVELGMQLADVDRNRDKAIRAFTVEDIRRAKREGKMAVIAALENGGDVIGNVLDRVDVLYGLGVRCMGLTYTKRNHIGDGQVEKTDSSISEFGYQVVERMNKLGMIIDLAHAGRQTSLDVIEASKDPVMITHAGMKALNPTPRLKTDEEVKALAEKGGIIGIEAAPNILSSNEKQGINDLLNHVDYVVNLVGVDHVGIGTDTLFGDHVALHHKIMEILGLHHILKGKIMAEYMQGIENPSEWLNVTRGLVARGYSDQEIQKIIGGNALRVLERVVG